MTNTRDSASPIDAVDEELIDTLIAITLLITSMVLESLWNPKATVR